MLRFSLKRLDPLYIVSSPPKKIEILPGEVKSFYAEATGDSQLIVEYTWNFTNSVGTVTRGFNFDSSIMKLSGGNKNLTLNATNLEGSDVYTKLTGNYQVMVGYKYDKRYYVINVTTDDSLIRKYIRLFYLSDQRLI